MASNTTYSDAQYSVLSSLDLYYISVSSDIFLYGYLIMMIIGFPGNICQILTFSRKTMRNTSTGVLFLALSISDTLYLLLTVYVLIVYGFNVTDTSPMDATCRLRHFFSYLTTNFSAWMLTTISLDRWIRSQFPTKSQLICTQRTACYCIALALLIDSLLNVHILTPFFGQIPAGVTSACGANAQYPSYVYFYTELWPIISALSVTIIPAGCMVVLLVGITVSVNKSRNRVLAIQQHPQGKRVQQERRRSRFMHRQMLILMLVTLGLFFITTLPIAMFRFAISTLNIQQSYTLSLLETAVFGVITTANYSLNFYLHVLSSKLFRAEFRKLIPC